MKGKYSKLKIVINKYNSSNPAEMIHFDDNIYPKDEDIISIGVKRTKFSNNTPDACRKKRGKYKRVYRKNDKGNIEVFHICEFMKNGKKYSERDDTDTFGHFIGIPVS